jgi:hypothetical protein
MTQNIQNKQAEEEWSLHQYKCSVCLYTWKYPSHGFVVLCESGCVVFHTNPQLLSFWQNYLIFTGLSGLHCLHHDCASQHHCSVLSARVFWKRNLRPLMTRISFPFSLHITLWTFTGSIFTPTAWHTTVVRSDRRTQLTLRPSYACYTTVIPENWPRDATNTLTLISPAQPLSEKRRGTQLVSRGSVRPCEWVRTFRSPASKSHLLCVALYWHLWPVLLYQIYPHYLTNNTIFRKHITEHKMCIFIFSTTLKHFSFWHELREIWSQMYIVLI